MLFCKGYKLAIDQDYGNETLKTVKQFQKISGIIVDGKAGLVTFSKLFS